jgi:hypothetical protein
VKQWVHAPVKATSAEKDHVVQACDAFIRDVLTPRFLLNVRETQFNYPIALHGDWRVYRYRFLIRYRSGFAENHGEEFDAPWARLELIGPDLFNIHWMRHTGRWWLLHRRKKLHEALHLIETDRVLRPHV